MPGKEVRGLFQALTEGGWGGLIGPTGRYILRDLDIQAVTSATQKYSSINTNLIELTWTHAS